MRPGVKLSSVINLGLFRQLLPPRSDDWKSHAVFEKSFRLCPKASDITVYTTHAHIIPTSVVILTDQRARYMFRRGQTKVVAVQKKIKSPSGLRQENSLQCFSRGSKLAVAGVEDLRNLTIRVRESLQDPVRVRVGVHRLDRVLET